MKEIPSELMNLVRRTNKLIEKAIIEENFKMHSHFQQSRESFLDMHSAHLSVNKMMGEVVEGLQEAYDNVNGSDITEIRVNILTAPNDLSLTIFTDSSYSTFFGMV